MIHVEATAAIVEANVPEFDLELADISGRPFEISEQLAHGLSTEDPAVHPTGTAEEIGDEIMARWDRFREKIEAFFAEDRYEPAAARDVARGDGATRLDDSPAKGLGLLQVFADVDAFTNRWREHVTQWENEQSLLDPEIDRDKFLEFKERRLTQLTALQVEMHGIALNVELVSKLIEHGTSSLKTALQTQT